MVEVMGKQMDERFKAAGIQATKTFEQTPHDDLYPFQVWELSEEELKRFEAMEWDEDGDGWYRYGHCIYEGTADTEFTVNGEKMKGYDPEKKYEDPDYDWLDRSFVSFTHYMYEGIGLSKNLNYVLFATSLAKDNGLTLAKFMEKHEG